MYSLTGEKVREDFNLTDSKLVIDRRNLVSGICFYQIKVGNKIIKSGKLVID
ncbi:MAG: hypothetical protein HRT71_16710 [Flavobacteriales bacterium]|nr:hypothetical protein [Flavobacteriales bacterium]